MITDYHAKYFAHALRRRRPSDSLEKLGPSLLDATIDLNPHQIDAALFAFRSPLSRGAILADEVGLGKTIEAGLIISQLWAERRRRILAIVPTTLRSQWRSELDRKLFIPAQVLDSKAFNVAKRDGSENPFDAFGAVVICSYNFARAKADEIRTVAWDLVVVDEAHRLRNVYKPSNKIANAIKQAVAGLPKVLLTATPLQNSLLELYGLVGFLDEHVFGDIATFRSRYMRGPVAETELAELRERLAPLCKRTLRRQVSEYVRYTKRIPITQDFTPTDEEQRLYDGVSAFLQREVLHALPSSQRKLMTLVLRRLLASSTYAIAGTLKALLGRLKEKKAEIAAEAPEPEEGPEEDFESFTELAEEWSETDEAGDAEPPETTQEAEIASEIAQLARHHDLARSVVTNAKGEALVTALSLGFRKLAELGAGAKAVIFTESRRTQQYLFELLEERGYAGRVMTLNGTNTDNRSAAIYEAWRVRHVGDDSVSGTKAVDLRSALIDHFRESADVLIATEAAAEGVNMQFCALVVNYDLPWNPQRIEQRIGRCHQYGQTHDVVVINFLNRKNEADQRVFQLLKEKFRLFEGVFGASDEVLGALESGVDFERRIADIYQACRTPAEIDAAFDALQREMDVQIEARMASTRAQLLENFDEEVRTRLRVNLQEAQAELDRLTRWLWQVTEHELAAVAEFDTERHRFRLRAAPPWAPESQTGGYQLRASPEASEDHVFRLGHNLAQVILDRAASRKLDAATVTFDYAGYRGKVSLVEALRGAAGHLSLSLVAVTSLDREEHLLFAAVTDDGTALPCETCEKLLGIPGTVDGPADMPASIVEVLDTRTNQERAGLLATVAERNAGFFEAEIEKLERWADDLKSGLERELKDLDTEIKRVKRDARFQGSLDAKVALQRQVKELEAERNRKRKRLFEAQDEIDGKKETVLTDMEAKLAQSVETTTLFRIRWRVA